MSRDSTCWPRTKGKVLLLGWPPLSLPPSLLPTHITTLPVILPDPSNIFHICYCLWILLGVFSPAKINTGLAGVSFTKSWLKKHNSTDLLIKDQVCVIWGSMGERSWDYKCSFGMRMCRHSMGHKVSGWGSVVKLTDHVHTQLVGWDLAPHK